MVCFDSNFGLWIKGSIKKMCRFISKGLIYYISKFRLEREGVYIFNIIIKYWKYCYGIMCKFSWFEFYNKYVLYKS